MTVINAKANLKIFFSLKNHLVNSPFQLSYALVNDKFHFQLNNHKFMFPWSSLVSAGRFYFNRIDLKFRFVLHYTVKLEGMYLSVLFSIGLLYCCVKRKTDDKYKKDN